MTTDTGSTLLRFLVIALVIALVREVSIRRHAADLHDWPRLDSARAGTR